MDKGSPITAIVLTLNEEQDLPRCLNSLTWCQKIVVVDSGSSDGTLAIARQWNCDIYEHAWPGFADQRNWALTQTRIETEWVLFVDADEVITKELATEIHQAIKNPAIAAYYVTFKVMLFGTWVKKSSHFPVWHPRLCRMGAVTFKNAITGHGETWDVLGRVGYLSAPYIHYCFSKGLTQWLYKHNRLSSMECDAYFTSSYHTVENLKALFSRDLHKRRQALRQLSFRLPGRPLLRFFYSYIVRWGFVEGRAGLVYCLLYLIYELMIQVKMIEKKTKIPRDHD
ncbi:glycosyltransferase family 2 protein [candidate division KSB1 bacterium]|nr:glycosyltransferase family 2 protein [candidate division KSB1 bacterium]RQW05731.1 MAG: glycosyltransferase family 2 protein [candidate division KSB1 bacterium]